jgi:hypothetical protein
LGVGLGKGGNCTLFYKDAKAEKMFDPSWRYNVGGEEKFRLPRNQVGVPEANCLVHTTVSQTGQTA